MTTTREVMRKVQEKGGVSLANGVFLQMERSRARDVPSSIDFRKRKLSGNYVKYQIYVNCGCVCTQLWCQNPCRPEFKNRMIKIAGQHSLYSNDVKAALGIHGGCGVDVSVKSVDQILSELEVQLQRLYDVFEDFLVGDGGGANQVEINKQKGGMKIKCKSRVEGIAPWIDVWRLTEKIDCSFDKKFQQITGLHWLPWVGCEYSAMPSKVLVLGESDYAGADMGATDEAARGHVNSDSGFIRKVIDRFGVRGEYDVTISAVARLIEKFGYAWGNIAFTDVCQEAVTKNEPPTQAQMEHGAEIIKIIFRILKPDCVICLGKKCVKCIPSWSGSFPKVQFIDVEYHPRYVMNFMQKELREQKLDEWATRIKSAIRRKTVPLYAVEDLKKGKEAKPVGRMRNPDLPGCVVDRKTFEKLYGVKFPD